MIKEISIKHKLTAFAVLPSTFVLITAILIFYIFDLISQKNELVQQASILSQVIGANNSAALLFNDTKSATDNLAVLSVNNHIMSGAIYSATGDVFASYPAQPSDASAVLPLLKSNGYYFSDNSLTICQGILANDTTIGTVCLKYNLDSLYAKRNAYLAIAAIILIVVSTLVFLLSKWIKKSISDPVLSLTETAKTITLAKDYNVRAKVHETGEFGLLLNCFNEMLDQIQSRDARLEKHGENLELQVSKRTAELKTSNDQLRIQIEENIKIEEELFKTRQLESLGILAGGIAHDFNNLLAAILLNTNLAKRHTPPESKIHTRLEGVENACMRAKDLTQQLLTFSKGGAPITKVTTIEELICDSARFVFRGSNSLCNFNISKDLWPVEVDEGQISQVIHNLAINAVHAMPEGGTVLICAENISVTKNSRLALKTGKYVKITVTDTGTGISKEIQAKIFTPYFTTKKTGSGLGLATSYSIISKHSGLITVDSEPGKGTTFSIYLPASENELAPKADKSEEFIKGSGRILIMDDDKLVQTVTGETLVHAGYQVDYAGCGAETIEAYMSARATEIPYDLIIMDLTIPGKMGGEETIKKLLELAPEVKAIAASGYAQGSIMSNFKDYGFKGVLAKPFSITELCRLTSQVIHQDQ